MNHSRSLRVLVVYNGIVQNGEAHVDQISEAAVQDEVDAVFVTLTSLGHEASLMPVSDWMEDVQKIRSLAPEVIFNLCEGYRGQARLEMNVAGIWELMGIPFTGNSALTLGVAQNKVIAKQLMIADGIPTPEFEVAHDIPTSTALEFPLIVKPSREDASVGVTVDAIVYDLKSLQKRTAQLIDRYRQPVLIERFIDGREFNVSIWGNQPPNVLPISEIDFTALDPDEPRITSYEAKWMEDHPVYLKTPAVCPAPIDEALRERIGETALRVWRALSGRDYGRVDLRVDPSGNVQVLEFNPNPDISPDVGFSRSLKVSGAEYAEFVNWIIEEAVNRP
jgi:D-alanine-D-alanine ligase